MVNKYSIFKCSQSTKNKIKFDLTLFFVFFLLLSSVLFATSNEKHLKDKLLKSITPSFLLSFVTCVARYSMDLAGAIADKISCCGLPDNNTQEDEMALNLDNV